ncbi:MAG: GHKL domain-containing protein [Saprospiraceae bacterium]|nr:GHKL domain-containing protein [Saprospiraceae bacterium]
MTTQEQETVQPRGNLSIADMEMLVLINRASNITAIAAFLYGSFAFFLPNGKINTIVSASVGTIFLLVNVFYRYRKLEAVKLYFSLVVPLWIMVDTICVGGDFSQSAAFLAITAMIYVLYEDRKTMQQVLVFVVLSMYTASTLIVQYNGTLFPPIEQPLDELIVMVVSVIWIFSMLGKRDKEKKRLIQSLEEKNKTLKATSEELERFTFIASHDLKSPLRNISSFLGLIERDMKRGDTTNFYQNLEFARKGAQQMHYLIQGILEISNINQDQFAHRANYDLGQLMEIAITGLRLEIAEKNAWVQLSSMPEYFCNDIEFTLLFQNLIQNGIKYNTSLQPKVSIHSKQDNEQLKIIFEDNGIGIEPKYHSYIFEHFKRLHTQSDYAGTGLGLSLCKKIVEKHGGSISLSSELGKGSQFIVALPVKPVQVASTMQ